MEMVFRHHWHHLAPRTCIFVLSLLIIPYPVWMPWMLAVGLWPLSCFSQTSLSKHLVSNSAAKLQLKHHAEANNCSVLSLNSILNLKMYILWMITPIFSLSSLWPLCYFVPHSEVIMSLFWLSISLTSWELKEPQAEHFHLLLWF